MSTQDALDRALDDLAAGRAPATEAGRAIAEAARCYFGTPAGAAMRRRQATQERDRVLIELARVHFNALPSVRARARAILNAARRYEAIGWLRDRNAVTNPRPPESVEGMVWAVLKAWPDMPSNTVLRDLLASAGL